MNSNQPALTVISAFAVIVMLYCAISEIAYPSPIQKIRSTIHKPGVQGIVDNMDTILHYSLPEYNVKITNIHSFAHDIKQQYTDTLLELEISKSDSVLIKSDVYTIYLILRHTFPDYISSTYTMFPHRGDTNISNIVEYLEQHEIICSVLKIQIRINLYDIDKDTLTKPMPYDGK